MLQLNTYETTWLIIRKSKIIYGSVCPHIRCIYKHIVVRIYTKLMTTQRIIHNGLTFSPLATLFFSHVYSLRWAERRFLLETSIIYYDWQENGSQVIWSCTAESKREMLVQIVEMRYTTTLLRSPVSSELFNNANCKCCQSCCFLFYACFSIIIIWTCALKDHQSERKRLRVKRLSCLIGRGVTYFTFFRLIMNVIVHLIACNL